MRQTRLATTILTSLTTLAALMVSGALVNDVQASCPAPMIQMSPDTGQPISATCQTVLVAIPDEFKTGIKDFTLEWTGGKSGVAAVADSYTVQQGEPFLDPKTCEEKWEVWDVKFLVYRLTAHQPLPLDTEIRITNGSSSFGAFKVSAQATFCPSSLIPTMGMCGSGGPAPVAGCGDSPPTAPSTPSGPSDPSDPSSTSDDPRSGGCSVSGSHDAGQPLLALALIGLLASRRRRRRGSAVSI